METASPAIRVTGLRKSYRDLTVLKGVDFGVARGSIFALLGSNGAGKTTVVRILSTRLKPDSGAASVHGFDVGSEPLRVRESISLTGQFAAVDEILTGRENLVMVGRLAGRGMPLDRSGVLSRSAPSWWVWQPCPEIIHRYSEFPFPMRDDVLIEGLACRRRKPLLLPGLMNSGQ